MIKGIWPLFSLIFLENFMFLVTLVCFLFKLQLKVRFFEIFEWKIKRINNADLFSQPSLVIYTKGMNNWAQLYDFLM